MNHFVRIFIAQSCFNLIASKPFDFFKFCRIVIDQPPGELFATRAQTGDQVPSMKAPSDFHDAGWEQTLSLLDDGFLRPIIHDDLPLWFWIKSNPMFPTAQGFTFREDQCPDLLPL